MTTLGIGGGGIGYPVNGTGGGGSGAGSPPTPPQGPGEPQEPPEGAGLPELVGRYELRVLARVLAAGRWEIPPQVRQALPAYLARKAMGLPGRDGEPAPSERHAMIAARILKDIMGQNQSDEHLAVKLATGVSDGPDVNINIELTTEEQDRVRRIAAKFDQPE